MVVLFVIPARCLCVSSANYLAARFYRFGKCKGCFCQFPASPAAAASSVWICVTPCTVPDTSPATNFIPTAASRVIYRNRPFSLPLQLLRRTQYNAGSLRSRFSPQIWLVASSPLATIARQVVIFLFFFNNFRNLSWSGRLF